MSYRIESDAPLRSEWMPPEVFAAVYNDLSIAIAMAIEGSDDPVEDNLRVRDLRTNRIVWRARPEDFE